MDSLRHQFHKFIMQQMAASTSTPSAQPPPYTPRPSCSERLLAQAEDLAEGEDDAEAPHIIAIDASTTVTGVDNVVNPAATAALSAKIAMALCAALRESDGSEDAGNLVRRRPIQINLDSSVRIVGARNVVGEVKMGGRAGISTSPSTVPASRECVGCKRKAEEDLEPPCEAKRVDVEQAACNSGEN